MLLLFTLVIIPPVYATDIHQTNPDPQWNYLCGFNNSQKCPGVDTAAPQKDVIYTLTSNLQKSFLNSTYGKNISRYILSTRPSYSDDGQLFRYSYSIHPDGTIESFTEIGDTPETKEIKNTPSIPREAGPDDTTLWYCDLQGLAQSPFESPSTLTLLSKDILIRNYSGLGRVCIVTSAYWDDQDSDRGHDYFTLDSHVKITPENGVDGKSVVKTRDVDFSYNCSQNLTGVIPLTDLWMIDARPGSSDLNEGGKVRQPGEIIPWYEYSGGPFSSSIALKSDSLDRYDWQVTTGYFSPAAERPLYLNPRVDIAIKKPEGCDSRVHLLSTTQFNGTRGWCRENGWFCEDSPSYGSLFGSEFYLTWVGEPAQQS